MSPPATKRPARSASPSFRVHPDTWDRFKLLCRERGTTASKSLGVFIEQEVADHEAGA